MSLNSLFCADVPLSNFIHVCSWMVINRLQIGQTHATHAHLLDDDDEAVCMTCYTSLTVKHIVIECPQFNHLCQQYRFGSTLKDLFNNTSVNDIIAFIKNTQFYNRI